jgi:hypothetical protein
MRAIGYMFRYYRICPIVAKYQTRLFQWTNLPENGAPSNGEREEDCCIDHDTLADWIVDAPDDAFAHRFWNIYDCSTGCSFTQSSFQCWNPWSFVILLVKILKTGSSVRRRNMI